MKKAILLISLMLIVSLNIAHAADVNINNNNLEKISILEGEEKTIQLNENDYTLKVDSVNDKEARISIQPTNLALVLQLEETVNDLDLDKDEVQDFIITFESSKDKLATFEVGKKTKTNQESSEESMDTEDKEESLNNPNITSILRQNMKFILGGMAILVILIIVFSRGKNNPEKIYTKAETLHKEAQEFHHDGDEETASELYDKAEELREKARELEKEKFGG